MRTFLIALRASVFAAGFVLLWAWVALSLRGFDPRFGPPLPAWTELPGIFLMTVGAALAFGCVGFFVVRGRGTPAPFDPPRQFVVAGPYKYVRNPMYIGGLALLLGLGLYLHSNSIVVFSLAWFLLAHLFVVGYEEPTLRRKFGATYESYCKAVPRWIPKRPPG